MKMNVTATVSHALGHWLRIFMKGDHSITSIEIG
ncbi:Uncharacterised protein [Escherichia coli]|nr:Uncharacterised protein [Escherichia coli]